MIQRIRPSEYLTDIRTMTDGERKDYLKRVGEWLAGSGRRLMQMTDRPMALSQNVVQLSVRWTADECRMFRDGTLLLTALVKVCDTWLPAQLYARSANRATRKVFDELSRVSGFKIQVSGDGKPGTMNHSPLTKNIGGAAAPYNQEPKRAAGAKPAQTGGTSPKKQTAKEEPAAGTSKATQAVAASDKEKPIVVVRAGSDPKTAVAGQVSAPQPSAEKGGAAPAFKPSAGGAVPPRPDHISQYIHLLPEATQERAKDYGSLMRQMEEAHANLALVADDPKASDKVREMWAKKVSGLDKQIGSLRRELDHEWEKVVKTGRVVMDDLGMAHVLAAEIPQHTEQDGGGAGADATAAVAGGKKLSKEVKAQIKSLRSWLRDTRGPKEPGEKRDAYVARWTEKYREMVALGGPDTVTDAVRKAAEVYGIKLNTLNDEKK